jgi:hypothetical protein
MLILALDLGLGETAYLKPGSVLTALLRGLVPTPANTMLLRSVFRVPSKQLLLPSTMNELPKGPSTPY